jgi:hypothetical protein
MGKPLEDGYTPCANPPSTEQERYEKMMGDDDYDGYAAMMYDPESEKEGFVERQNVRDRL